MVYVESHFNNPVIQLPHLQVRKLGPWKWYVSYSRSKSALKTSYVDSWFNVFLPYHRNVGDLFVFCLYYLHSQEGLALSLNLEISLWRVRTFLKMSQESYANPNPRKSLPFPLLSPKKYSFIFCFQSILSSQGSSVFQVRSGVSSV